MNGRKRKGLAELEAMEVELDRKAEARKREVADRGGANARLGVSVLEPGLLPRRGARLAVHEVRTATVGCLRRRSLDTPVRDWDSGAPGKGSRVPVLTLVR